MKKVALVITIVGGLLSGCSSDSVSVASDQTVQEAKKLSLEEEKQILKETFGQIQFFVASIKGHYDQHSKSYEPQSWDEFQKNLSAQITSVRSKLINSFSAPYSSKEIADAVFIMDDILVKLDMDVLPEIQRKLEGTGGNHEALLIEIEKELEKIKIE